nr:MAG TPA: helix-turn-helix domain protein [Caudoviricetes sp.]
MTQCDRILRHLESGGSLTAAQAMQEYGIYRLASRASMI